MKDEDLTVNPKKQLYYKRLALLMTFTAVGKQEWWGFGPNKNKFVWFNSKCCLTLGPMTTVLQVVFGYQNYKLLKQNKLFLMFLINMVVTLGIIMKIFMAQRQVYRECLTLFLNEFHLYHFQERDDYTKKKAIQMERFSRYSQYFYYGMSSAASLWIIVPTVKNFQHLEQVHNKTMMLQASTYVWMPFDIIYNFRNWLIFEVMVVYLQFVACVISFFVDAFSLSIMFHLIGHFQILTRRLETEDWVKMNDAEVKETLIDIYKHHALIKTMFDQMQGAYGFNAVVIYLCNLLLDSMILYESMFGEKQNIVLYVGMGMVYFLLLVTLSFIAEKIRGLSEDFHASLYCCPWETMSVSNQKMVYLMLMHSHASLDYKAFGITIGYQPMIGIIKTTFSYFVMLKELN